MQREETIDFHIRWAWAKISKSYNTEAGKEGATMAMAYALLTIEKDGTPSTRLGPMMGMEPTSMTRLLNSLESQGYIKRKQDKTDGRKMIVVLTEKGLKYRDIARQKVKSMNQHLQERIPAKKLKVFFEVMQIINQELDKNNLFEQKQ